MFICLDPISAIHLGLTNDKKVYHRAELMSQFILKQIPNNLLSAKKVAERRASVECDKEAAFELENSGTVVLTTSEHGKTPIHSKKASDKVFLHQDSHEEKEKSGAARQALAHKLQQAASKVTHKQGSHHSEGHTKYTMTSVDEGNEQKLDAYGLMDVNEDNEVHAFDSSSSLHGKVDSDNAQIHSLKVATSTPQYALYHHTHPNASLPSELSNMLQLLVVEPSRVYAITKDQAQQVEDIFRNNGCQTTEDLLALLNELKTPLHCDTSVVQDHDMHSQKLVLYQEVSQHVEQWMDALCDILHVPPVLAVKVLLLLRRVLH